MLFPPSRNFKKDIKMVHEFAKKYDYAYNITHFQRLDDDEKICVTYEFTDGDELTFFFVKFKDFDDLYTKSIYTFSLDEYDTSSIEPRLIQAKKKLDNIL
jgi:hypothetical protein